MPFAPLARQSKDADYNGERLVNYIAHQSDTIAPLVLLGRTGLSQLHDLSGHVRAMAVTKDAMYVAAKSQLWKVTVAAATSLGTILDGETYIAADGDKVAVAVAGSYWAYDGTTLSAPITGGVTSPRGVTYADGYFIVWGGGQGRDDAFQVCKNLNDPTEFDPLDVLFARAAGDSVSCIMPLSGVLSVIGTQTIETWFNAGNATGVYAPASSGAMERGCINGATVAKDERSLFFVGENGRVYRALGGQPIRISTPEIEPLVATAVNGFVMNDRGHQLYVLARDSGTALAYDIDLGVWSEFSTGTGAWIGKDAAHFNGVQYIGTTSGISTLTGYQDHGADIIAEVVSPPVVRDGRFNVPELQVMVDTGRTALAGGLEPQIMGRFSRDGENWTPENWRGLGFLGEYARKVTWRGLGSFDQRFQCWFRISDAVNRDIHGVKYG